MKKFHALILSLILLFICIKAHLSTAGDSSNKVRPPAVAGMFYPGAPDDLSKMVRTYLKDARGVKVPGKIRGLVSPHAGYIYSGIVAAAGYRQIDPSTRTVILLGPSHRFPLRGTSIPEVRAYRTPLGDVRLARLASTLLRSPDFESVPEAHRAEPGRLG